MTDATAGEATMRRIRALLNQAENAAATEHEAQTFREKAFELMATYGVEQAMLGADKPDRATPEGRNTYVYLPWAAEGVALLGGIAHALGCRPVLLRTQPGEPKFVRVLGFASDLDRVEVLYNSLLVQMHAGLLSATVPDGANGRAWRRSWLIGFVAEVSDRLTDAEDRARQAATDNGGRRAEIILADRGTRVLELQSQEFPNLGKPRPRTFIGTGLADGRAAGARADIGNPRINDQKRDAIDR
ncbi:DUF2786 domain-containing protein [Jiangella muralis]|uniref:DUF2786 domain-containing protein n=1 Tax=Jiangella muralis TaxID=702383 RepID=UPI00069D534A|nr:DUF2786 domain-containing protein [Jiangella muralis]